MLPKSKSKKSLKFQTSHEEKFGLKITARDPESDLVSSCVCRFCLMFGREKKVGAKRKATSRVKYFDCFRTDNYIQHLQQQHQWKWAEYDKLQSFAERDMFFNDVQVPFVNTLEAHFERNGALYFTVNKSIVKDIIGGLLFHPDDMEGVTVVRALSLFQLIEPEDNDKRGDDDFNRISRQEYSVQIKSSKRFSLLVGCVALGASFRLAARMVQLVRDESGLSVYGGCNDLMASNYTRVACAVCLQVISDVLGKLNGYSIALDCSTLHGMSYLDIRVRFTLHGILYNFHLLALPLFDRHTGELMFEAFVKFMDALYPPMARNFGGHVHRWRSLNDGRIHGFVTQVGEVTSTKLIRVWCGLHQLDLVMQQVFKSALDDDFYSTLTAVIGHLRRQQNLVATMRSMCPKVADTRWVSMDSVSTWLTTNIIALLEHFDTKKPHCTPDKTWWLFLLSVKAFAQESMLVFTSMQGLTTLLSQQRAKLLGLIDTYCRMTNMTGPHSDEKLASIDHSNAEVYGGFVLTYANSFAYIESLGLWAVETISVLEQAEVDKLVPAVARLFVKATNGIQGIVSERDAQNNAGDELPPVLPKQLVKLDMRAFSVIVTGHKPRLQLRMLASEINQIGVDFNALLRTYREDNAFKIAVDSCIDADTDFVDGWSSGAAGERFPTLRQFCRDLASTFPNTATVETDFSIIGWEKDEFRKSLTDFSLEGILHCKQFDRLKSLHASF
ncbi:hypothetical protein BASA61_007792 [Batrachochytrium salamandrivorans]|nr:hypothetical protein BASA61_007792 [Batrachochytrium salamandrivorans]